MDQMKAENPARARERDFWNGGGTGNPPDPSREAAACDSPARKCRVRMGKVHESRRDGTRYSHTLLKELTAPLERNDLFHPLIFLLLAAGNLFVAGRSRIIRARRRR
jgi:hypothetical protein